MELLRCRYYLFLLFCFLFPPSVFAQQPVKINDKEQQHIFTFSEIEQLPDPSGKITFSEIKSSPLSRNFKASKSSTPQNNRLNQAVWYRITIYNDGKTARQWLLEFFDQTIDDITAYLPGDKGNYTVEQLGDAQPFHRRDIRHKNFEIPLRQAPGYATYYFRLKSHQPADVIIVLRSVNWFVQYANSEYLTFGIFYGMILIFGFYNLLMFMAVRLRKYLYYTLYLFSVGMYELCTDGLAYQYLWPAWPAFNQYAFGIALCLISVFCLLFTRALLNTRTATPALDKIILATIYCRIAFFIFCLVFNRDCFNYKFIEFIPLVLAFSTGIVVYRKGYRAALYFIIGYGCLCFGFLYKVLIMLHFGWLNFGAVTYYSLTICFIAEMVFLSMAIAAQVSRLKRAHDKAQLETIAEMRKNSILEQKLNRELEHLVSLRTTELQQQSALVASQNQVLEEQNKRLQQQAEEISRMNVLLEKDNEALQINVTAVTRSRIMSEGVDFSEFSKIYPDNESCFSYLSGLKWNNGYRCRKCRGQHYFAGHTPHSRRCSKCDYDESVTAYTIFQNSRIPITKAFYLLFLMYSSKGKISSHKLSEMLDIRQGTCWSYSTKILKLMKDRKKLLKSADNEGWRTLLLED